MIRECVSWIRRLGVFDGVDYHSRIRSAMGAFCRDGPRIRADLDSTQARRRRPQGWQSVGLHEEKAVNMSLIEQQVAAAREWFALPRFAGIERLYTPRDVAEQQGTIRTEYTVAATAAEGFLELLRSLFAERRSITTFGPYSPGQAVAMKRLGIPGIYLGGWATSAKGSRAEDPGPDLASYPLSQVPDEAAVLVRALLTADRNQHFARSRMTEAQRRATPEVDFRPFIIADADTGHGGDGHVRNLIRRFVEVGVPGYHIEDQRPGTKKCGHQAGKVLVSSDEQIKRLNAARLQLDIMRVPGIIVARTDAEAATFLDNRGDERDHPFILGATRTDIPSYKAVYLAMSRQLCELGCEQIRGHLLFAMSESGYAAAFEWLDRVGLTVAIAAAAKELAGAGTAETDTLMDALETRLTDVWQVEAGMKTYRQAVADVIAYRTADGERLDMNVEEWLAFSERASLYDVAVTAANMGVQTEWDCEHAKTAEGFYQVQGGIEYAIAKSLAAAPFADLLWMETKTADLEDARTFAEAIHARFPDKMLAYNLSPSFNWDTTGMSDDEMRRFPAELGKLGFVFNFITYGGHQIDGVAAEEFATGLKQNGMLALAQLQRKIRLVESPYRTPQTLVGGPRLDAALMASSGRTAATKAMGKGSTQHQHLVQTEVPTKVLEGWLELWKEHYQYPRKLRVQLRPSPLGAELLQLTVFDEADAALASIIFATIRDRRGKMILTVRDQNTLPAARAKRLMTLLHLFLLHRYEPASVYYLSPTEDNLSQSQRMKGLRLFADVHTEIGQIIVAQINRDRIAELLKTDQMALKALIQKTETSSPAKVTSNAS
jgi:isocitrate lyase